MKNVCRVISADGNWQDLSVTISRCANVLYYTAKQTCDSQELLVTEIFLFVEQEPFPLRFPMDSVPIAIGESVRWEVAASQNEEGAKQYRASLVRYADSWSKLHRAALSGDLARVNSLLQAGADPNEADSHDNSPLHLAAKSGSIEVVNSLIGAGADVNATTTGGHGDVVDETPLHCAVQSGQVSVVVALLQAGAVANSIATLMRHQGWRRTPLDVAVHLGHKQIIERLVAAGGTTCVDGQRLPDEPMTG